MKRFLVVLALILTGAFAQSSYAADIGVVFMHGKWGGPNTRPLEQLTSAMKRAGFEVEVPEMPWSRDRAYDKDVEGAIAEIDVLVERLKSRGATKIVVGGHSLGAAMSLAFGARREGLAGILAVAPGHTPELKMTRDTVAADLARARGLIAEGKGNEKLRFADLNQGKTGQVGATPSNYVTWFDPQGPSVMPLNAANVKPGTPLYWVIGKDDGLTQFGERYAYAKVPPHPKSAYVVVSGGHVDTPNMATNEIIAWIKSL